MPTCHVMCSPKTPAGSALQLEAVLSCNADIIMIRELVSDCWHQLLFGAGSIELCGCSHSHSHDADASTLAHRCDQLVEHVCGVSLQLKGHLWGRGSHQRKPDTVPNTVTYVGVTHLADRHARMLSANPEAALCSSRPVKHKECFL